MYVINSPTTSSEAYERRGARVRSIDDLLWLSVTLNTPEERKIFRKQHDRRNLLTNYFIGGLGPRRVRGRPRPNEKRRRLRQGFIDFALYLRPVRVFIFRHYPISPVNIYIYFFNTIRLDDAESHHARGVSALTSPRSYAASRDDFPGDAAAPPETFYEKKKKTKRFEMNDYIGFVCFCGFNDEE